MTAKSSTISRSFTSPDTQRQLGNNGQTQIIDLDSTHQVCRNDLKPGFRFSDVNKTMTKKPHVGYLIAGRLNVKDSTGSESIIESRHVYSIPAGSDFWADEQCEMLNYEFETV